MYILCTNFISFYSTGDLSMSRLKNLVIAATLSMTATVTFASPAMLITHNTTHLDSNAFIAGTIPSNHPTRAQSDNKVAWVFVKMACFGHTIGTKCPALIKVGTNTATPVEIGTVMMDLNSGDITPKQLSANGYTLLVNGLGETTIFANK